jgi:Dimerisation and cyclophilin-binding domain of Mon2
VFFIHAGLLESSVDVIQPFLLGCDTKNPKIVQLCLGTTQRLISQQLLNAVRVISVEIQLIGNHSYPFCNICSDHFVVCGYI